MAKVETDCVSREAAIRGLGERPLVWNDEPQEFQEVADWETAKQMLENLPSIDAIRVVRCKDCVDWDRDFVPQYGGSEDAHFCGIIGLVTDGNFYCAKGERLHNAC